MPHATRLLSAALVSATLLTGCARTIVVEPQETSYDPNDVTAQLDFWHELPGRSAITNDEGIHGIILMINGTDETGSYENRLAFLETNGWLPKGLGDEASNVAMQRGTLASILTRAMDIEGGVMMRLTDKSPRYAYRELVYMNLMPEGSEQMVLDGLDYVGVISKCEDHMRREAAKARAQAAPVDNDAVETAPASE